STSKKSKMEENTQIEPVVTDLFQEESTREVTISTGGLLAENLVPEGGKVVLGHKVRHQVAVPLNYAYTPISQHVRPSTPARTYPFKLDPFQEYAISCIERSESVLVSAHTSAGKTVVAEYAIAQSLNNKQRVIYTSPIKALSNQKYRELQHEFKDVGLMTGDVTINQSSSCLVMTTEILRSMLYRGSEILPRGVVWEETIIMLPHTIHTVFLSATIPNAMDFAEWICKIHRQPCHVVYTDFRPTPLQHYIYINGSDGIYLLVDEKGTFHEDAFQKSISTIREPLNPKPKNFNNNNNKLKRTCISSNLNPIIAFAFSKKQCEFLAMQMNDEKELINKVVENAIDLLAEEDRQLKSIHNLLPLLKRGIGIHHSGLLPFLKEVVELLFQEGLIKVLFATETFSMGLNMPAKTVVFCELTKYDGIQARYITSGEYIQMSGRAGRRGLDDRGNVIMNIDTESHFKVIKDMVKGEPDTLLSAFHLKYHMILMMSRIEGISPEYMLQNSFYQFQNTLPIPRLQAELKKVMEEIDNLEIENEESVAQYNSLVKLKEEMTDEFNEYTLDPRHCLKFLNFGRLILVKYDNVNFGWGMVVRIEEIKQKKNEKNPLGVKQRAQLNSQSSREIIYKVRVLLRCSSDSFASYDGKKVNIKPCPKNTKNGIMLVVPLELNNIQKISQIRLHPDKNIEHEPSIMNVAYDSIKTILAEHPNGVPLDPIKHMEIKSERFSLLYNKMRLIEENIKRHPVDQDPSIIEKYDKKLKLIEESKSLKNKIREAESILQLDELKKRKRLLRRMGYLSESDVVEFKGRIASEITSGDEIVLTELLLNGVFNDLSAESAAALLSCFVIDEKVDEMDVKLREEFNTPYRQVLETARIVAEITAECNIAIDKEEYLGSFSPVLMESVFAWCNNASFLETCKRVNMYEGNIVRNFKSLDELLRAMVLAAKCIGNIELENKFSQSIEKIKKGIIFAASLYL
ncbi:7818_t:CDS:10, partial [Entrophospora sp. SA101]